MASQRSKQSHPIATFHTDCLEVVLHHSLIHGLILATCRHFSIHWFFTILIPLHEGYKEQVFAGDFPVRHPPTFVNLIKRGPGSTNRCFMPEKPNSVTYTCSFVIDSWPNIKYIPGVPRGKSSTLGAQNWLSQTITKLNKRFLGSCLK